MENDLISREPVPICHGDCGALTPEEARNRLLPNLSISTPGGDIMNDLINRETLHDEIYGSNRPEVYDSQDIANWQMKCINSAPAVDAEPVQYGRWGEYHITGYDGLHPTYTAPCSVCSYEARFTHRFCPNCGAKMSG